MQAPLALGIAARSLAVYRGGVDAYVDHLVRHVAVLARDAGHRLTVMFDDAGVAARYDDAPCVREVLPPSAGGKLVWDHWTMPRACARLGLDAVLNPRSFRPLRLPCPGVTIVYDMMYHDARAQLYRWDHGWYFRALHRRSLHRSDAIVVFSEFTRSRVLANAPRVRAEQIAVVAPGPPDERFRVLGEEERRGGVLARLGVRAPFALVIGTHPRKAPDVVVRALADPAAPRDLALVFVSASTDAAHVARLSALAAGLGVGGRVAFLHAVAIDDLVALYNLATVTVYASPYEGIGMPPVEAMACGCPVVAAASSAIPEVVGDAALPVPPGDPASLARAVRSVVDDPALAASLRTRGFARHAQFDWRRTASAVLRTMESAARRGRDAARGWR